MKKVNRGIRVKLDAKVFPRLAHIVWTVAEWPEVPTSHEMQALQIEAEDKNERAGQHGPWVVLLINERGTKWRTAWTSHLVPVGEIGAGLDLSLFSLRTLDQLAEIALQMDEIEAHAMIAAEIERRER